MLHRALSVILLVALIAGCGGSPISYAHGGSGSGTSGASGSGSSGGTQPSGPVQGVYYGQITVPGTGSSTPVYGALGAQGYSYVATTAGDVYVLPSLGNPTAISGSVSGLAPPGMTLPSGQSTVSYNFSGSATGSNTTYYSSVTGTLADSPLTPGSLQLSYQSGSQAASPVSQLVGTFHGAYWGSKTALTMTISADGTFTGNDAAGCNLSGKIVNVANGQNLFSVTMSVSGPAPCPGSLAGAGYVDRVDYSGLVNTGDYYLYLSASNGSTAVMLVLLIA